MEIHLDSPGHTAADAFNILCDYERYPAMTDAVRSVHVYPLANGRVLSRWEVTFRAGILQWTEEDTFDPTAHTIRFEQTEGDIDHFAGLWAVEDTLDGCRVHFCAEFDLGIPEMGATLEPVAERGLRENIHAIVAGLLGAATPSSSVVAAAA